MKCFLFAFINYYENINGKVVNITDEIPFKFNNNVSFCRLKTITDVRDGTHESPKYYEIGYPFITSKNLKNGIIDFTNIKYISLKDFTEFNFRSNAEEDDILFGMIGTIGNPVLLKSLPFKFAFKNMALIKNFSKFILSKYIYYNILFLEAKFNKEAMGGVQKFISLDYIRNSIIPFCNLQAQKSIVDKLDYIFNLIIL